MLGIQRRRGGSSEGLEIVKFSDTRPDDLASPQARAGRAGCVPGAHWHRGCCGMLAGQSRSTSNFSCLASQDGPCFTARVADCVAGAEFIQKSAPDDEAPGSGACGRAAGLAPQEHADAALARTRE